MLGSLYTNLYEISDKEQKVNTNSYTKTENMTDYGLCNKARDQTSGDLFTEQIFIEHPFQVRHCATQWEGIGGQTKVLPLVNVQSHKGHTHNK